METKPTSSQRLKEYKDIIKRYPYDHLAAKYFWYCLLFNVDAIVEHDEKLYLCLVSSVMRFPEEVEITFTPRKELVPNNTLRKFLESMAVALLLLKDFISDGKFDPDIIQYILLYADRLGCRKEFDKAVSTFPPMIIKERYPKND